MSQINIFWLLTVVFCVIKMLSDWVSSDSLFQNFSLWLTKCIESFKMNINNKKIVKMLWKMSFDSEFSSEDKLNDYSWIKSWIIILKQFKTISTDMKLHTWLSDSLFKNRWLFYYKNYWLSLQVAKKNQCDEDLKSVLWTIHAVKMKSECWYIRENLNTSQWNETDWTAKLFLQTMKNNEKDHNSVLYEKQWFKKKKQSIWWCLLIKMKTEHSSVKFSKLSENKEQLIYTDQKLQQFEFICTSILTNAKLTVSVKITADSESIKKNKFKKLKKSISESDSNDVQLSDIEKTTSISDIVQTSDTVNQKKKIMISDYHFKASWLNDRRWRKILKKHKWVLNSLDKKSSLV